MTAVTVTSFGYDHSPIIPAAHLTLDVRKNLRNPHHDPVMRYLTGLDEQVRQHVLATPGAKALILGTTMTLVGLVESGCGPVEVAVGCVGGRHRSVALAEEIADALRGADVGVQVVHRDVAKPVIQPTSEEMPCES